VIAAILQVKTLERVPAAGETTEVSAAGGWALAANSLLRRLDAEIADAGTFVGKNMEAGSVTYGTIMRATSSVVLKSGLPGQETIPGLTKSLATTLGQVDELLCVVQSDLSGATTVTTGTLFKCRFLGRLPTITLAGTAVGDSVYVGDTGIISKTAGTIRRRVGSVMAATAGRADVWFDGAGTVDITPIDAPYTIYGAPGVLTNANRIDGANATGVSGGVSYTLKQADAATIALVLKRFTDLSLDLLEWQTQAGALLGRIRANGTIYSGSGNATNPAITGEATVADGIGMWGIGKGAGSGVSGMGDLTSTGDGITGIGGGSGVTVGVRGTAGTAADGVGVLGIGSNFDASIGVEGRAPLGATENVWGGVFLGSGTAPGAEGIGGDLDGPGIKGTGGATNGVGGDFYGTGTGSAVKATADNGIGVQAYSAGDNAISALSDGGDAIVATSTVGYGAVISGDTTSPAIAAYRIVPQNADPTGPNQVGDMYVNTSGVLHICTVAGTPGTWTHVGAQ
jgi:hypothetical protein